MKNILKGRKWLAVVAVAIGLSACVNPEDFDTDKISDKLEFEDMGLMLKLAKAELTVGDIFAEVTDTLKYYTDKEGNERIMFYMTQTNFVSYGIEDLPELDLSNEQSIMIPFTGAAGELSQQIKIPAKMKGVELSALNAAFDLNVAYSNMEQSISLKLQFSTPSAEPVIINIPRGGGNIAQTVSQNLQMENGTIPVWATISVPAGNASSQLGKLTLKISNPSASYVKGKVISLDMPMPEKSYSFDFGKLTEFAEGIQFFNPSMSLPINNNTELSGIANVNAKANMSNATTVKVDVDPIPFKAGNDTVTVDKTNSNITDFTNGEALPEEVIVDGLINLTSNNKEIELNEQSEVSVDCTVQIPMDMAMSSSYKVDTIDIDSDVIEDMLAAKLRINSFSELPVDADILFEMYDEDTQSIIGTIKASIIRAASVAANGIVTKASMSVEEIELTANQLENLRKSEKLILNLALKTSNYDNNQNVVILTSYKLNFDLTIKGKIGL